MLDYDHHDHDDNHDDDKQLVRGRTRVRVTAEDGVQLASKPPIGLPRLHPRLAAAEREWAELLEEHLPGGHQDEYWRSTPRGLVSTAHQGWKLHVSATLLSAPDALRRTSSVLGAQDTHWKVAATLDQVHKLNCGLYYGYSQIGKILTIYAGEPTLAIDLARRLDVALTDVEGPRVPFDIPVRVGSVVHYRYGLMNPQHFVDVEGTQVPALVDPEGRLFADQRRAGFAVPDWVEPLMDATPERYEGPLATRYLVYEVITQRGKGGTYRAVDVGSDPVSRCIVREGRRHGETDWDGLDGRDRVSHEKLVLRELARSTARVPAVLNSFVTNEHQYLVLESLDGPDLQRRLASTEPDQVEDLLRVARQAAELVADVHAAGWAWRDCKPANMVVTPTGLYGIDFEGACRLDERNVSPWGSPGHIPPEWPAITSPATQDLYALGAVLSGIFNVVESRDPETASQGKQIASELQGGDPEHRPSARSVVDRLP